MSLLRTGRAVKVKRVDCSLVCVEVVAREEHRYQEKDALVLEHLDEVGELLAHSRGRLNFHEGAIGAYNRVRRQDKQCRSRAAKHNNNERLRGNEDMQTEINTQRKRTRYVAVDTLLSFPERMLMASAMMEPMKEPNWNMAQKTPNALPLSFSSG
jgi:hypothetical protein